MPAAAAIGLYIIEGLLRLFSITPATLKTNLISTYLSDFPDRAKTVLKIFDKAASSNYLI